MKLLKFSMLVLVLAMGFLYLVYSFLIKGYKTFFEFEHNRLTELIRGKESYDVLFIGSSRTYYHIDPAVIDSVLHVNSFNAGIDGATILEMKMILECFLATHPAPKYIVLDFSTTAFNTEKSPIWNPNIYYPFLDNAIVYNTLAPYKRVGLLKYLPFLQITEWDDMLREGAFSGVAGRKKQLPPYYKGYLESGNKSLPLPFKRLYLATECEVADSGVALFKEFIETCQKNDIRLLTTYAPVYKYMDEYMDEKMNPKFFPTIQSICDSNAIPFLNYRNLPMNTNNLIFRDEIHLNKAGAQIYSRLVANDIKKIQEGEIKSMKPNGLYK